MGHDWWRGLDIAEEAWRPGERGGEGFTRRSGSGSGAGRGSRRRRQPGDNLWHAPVSLQKMDSLASPTPRPQRMSGGAPQRMSDPVLAGGGDGGGGGVGSGISCSRGHRAPLDSREEG